MFCARLLALWRSARAYDALSAKSPFSYATNSSNDNEGIEDDGDATMVSLLKAGNEPLVLHRLQHRTYTLEDLCAIEYGDSVLSLACKLGCLDIVTLLLDTTPFASIPEYKVRSIAGAFSSDNVTILKLLLARIPDMDLNAKQEGGSSILHEVARTYSPSGIQRLIVARTLNSTSRPLAWMIPLVGDVNMADDEGNTPLHIAARDNYNALYLLLEAGADVEARNKARDTPLHLAVASDYSLSVSLLLCESAAMDVTNEAGQSPLDLVQSDEIRALLTDEVTFRNKFPGHRLARQDDVVRMDLWLRTIYVGKCDSPKKKVRHFFKRGAGSFAQVTWRSETDAPIIATIVPTPAMSAYQLIGAANGVPVLGTWTSNGFLELTFAYTTKLRRTFKGPFDPAAGTWTGACDDAPSLHYAFPSYICVTCADEVVLNQDTPCLNCLRVGTTEAALEYRLRVKAATAAVAKALKVRDPDYRTVVMVAAMKGSLAVLRCLLPYCTEALLKKKDKYADTALDMFAWKHVPCATKNPGQNSTEFVHVLNELCRLGKLSIPMSSSLEYRWLGCCTMDLCVQLEALARANQWDEVKAELLQALETSSINDTALDGVNCRQGSGDVCHPDENLIWRNACAQGRADVIELLLLLPWKDMKIRSRDESVLYIAAKYGHATCVERLLLAGADPEFLVYHPEYSPSKAKTPIWPYPRCKRLIMDKREVKKQGFHLYFKANVPNVQAVHELQAADRTALHAAVLYKQRPQVITELVNENLVNDMDLHGETALMLAARLGQTDIVRCLLDVNAKVNLKNKRGETALWLAALSGHVDIVKQLLERYADIHIVNNRGTPLSEDLMRAVLNTKNDHATKNALLQIQAILEEEVQVRGSPEFRAAFAAHLALKDTDEAFTKQAFRKAIACSPAFGRMFLNDCVTLDRRDMRFSHLEYVYGTTADTSALHAILILQSSDPELLLDAKTECLEHVVMLRILQIKWELFGQRKYFEQLLMNVLLLVTMTTSSLLVDGASVATNWIPMVVGTLAFVSAVVGYGVLQLLRPASLYRLARYCYDGQLSLDVSASIPHLPKHKARARVLLVRAWMGLSLVIALPVIASLLSTGVASDYPRCNHLVLWCTSLYFVITELEEMASSGIKVYWSSRVNQAQLLTGLVVLLVFVPMKFGLLPAPWAVQTGVGGAITIGLWMLSLQFLEVVPAAGYLLPMMSKLLDDVRNFFIFFSVVQMGVTITFYQLFRDQDVDAFNTLGSSFVTTYFVAFGQLPLDALDAFDATDGFLSNCTLLLMMLHSAVVCILLLNVLLAMMNQTVDGGLEKAKTEALTSYAQCILRLEQSMRLNADGTQELLHLIDSKTNARVLNPIFSEVVSNLDILMRPEHEASIRHDNTRKQRWKTTLTSLQATITKHIGAVTTKLRRVEHFSRDPEILRGFQPELEAIAVAEEALASLFTKALKHRGEDAPAKLEALKTSVRDTIKTLSAKIDELWSDETTPWKMAMNTRTECVVLFGLAAVTTMGKLVQSMAARINEELDAAVLDPVDKSETKDQHPQAGVEKITDDAGGIHAVRVELQAQFAALETKLNEQHQALQTTLREQNRALREQNQALETTVRQQNDAVRQLTTALEQLSHAPESPIRTQSHPVLDPRERERSSVDTGHDSL